MADVHGDPVKLTYFKTRRAVGFAELAQYAVQPQEDGLGGILRVGHVASQKTKGRHQDEPLVLTASSRSKASMSPSSGARAINE